MKPLWFALALVSAVSAAAQLPDPALFSTAANGSTGRFPVDAPDSNWEVAVGDSLQPTGPFVAAHVLGRCEPDWYQSLLPNADWVGYDFGNGCWHTAQGCLDLYFRRHWTLPATNGCGLPIGDHYCLPVNLYGDNCVFEVLVNGVSNYVYHDTVPPYGATGFRRATSLNLCNGWQAGDNTVLVHLKSCPLSAGLLAEAQVRPTVLNLNFLGPDTSLCLANEVVLRSPFANTVWFDGTVGFEKMVSQSGTYRASIPDENGCEVVDSVAVQFDYKYFIPNAFAPESSGGNERFGVFFSEQNVLSFRLVVFDRWGNQMFVSTDPAASWDGTFRGKTCPAGVYVYVVEVAMGNCRKRIEGDVSLVR